MNIYDATFPIHEAMAVWPGDPTPRQQLLSAIHEGATATTGAIFMSLHTGTHVDAPAHVLPNGISVEQLPSPQLIGPATVVEVPEHHHKITVEFLHTLHFPPGARVLFKTRNTWRWKTEGLHFTPDYVAFTPEAATYLIEQQVALIGIDGFSVDEYAASDLPVHRQFLQHNVVIVELLNLTRVVPGEYFLITAPLKVANADGAPARVFLFQQMQ